MVKKIQPKPYYLIDMRDVAGGKYVDDIYDWAINQGEYMPDGDGHVPMWGIPELRETYDWASRVWDMLTLFQQNEIMRNDAELRMEVYQ